MSDIHAVVYQQGSAWIVQGIEHDICCQVRERDKAESAFVEQLRAEYLIARHLGHPGLSVIKPAPERFARMIEDGADTIVVRWSKPPAPEQPK